MDPKTILDDLQKELQGELLTSTEVVRDRSFEFRLLNEEESSWMFSLMDPSSELNLALSARIATLSVGIRSIDGVSTVDLFTPVVEQLKEESDVEYSALLSRNSGSLRFACFELFKNYLTKLPPEFISELNAHWKDLTDRRDESNEQIKNSSGEISETEEKTNLTEVSPDGESTLSL